MIAIRDSLQELSTLSEQLNNSTDELNEIIGKLEAKLADAGPGVSVWLDDSLSHELARSEEVDHFTFWELGYTKLGTQWRLAARQSRKWEVDRDSSGNPEFEYRIGADQEPIPLVQAPRAVRVEAAPLLDHLVQAIAKRVKTFLGHIEQAKELVE